MLKLQTISVIIPVYNEEKVIGRCLESLGGQTMGAKEVIVVDDGSTDKTWDVLSEFRVQSSEFRIFRQEHKGAGAARNLGVKKATGEILVFVDADMTFSRTFLADLIKPIQEGKSKGTFSKREYIANWNNRWARFWNYRRGTYEPRAVPEDYPETAPVFRAILKTEFDKAGGFDETRGYNDDWSLSEKLGYQATAAKARFYHYNPESLAEAFIQARWAGKRKYKFGILGGLIREFPLWAPILGAIKVIRKRGRIAESLLVLLTLYPVFLLVVSFASIIGIIEFAVYKKIYK